MTDSKRKPKSEAPPPILVVDVDALLDRSAWGKHAAHALQTTYDEMQVERQGKSATESDEIEEQILLTLEAEREKLRHALAEKITPILEEIRTEAGADVVLPRSVVAAFRPDLDITERALLRLDAAISLSRSPTSSSSGTKPSRSPPVSKRDRR